MSQLALQTAAAARLRSALLLTEEQCGERFDGRPPAVAGELFIAVHPGEWRGVEIEGIQESFGVEVTVTLRLGTVPDDRAGPELLNKARVGLNAWCERVRAALWFDYTTLDAANATITDAANGFIEPLRLRDGGRPTPRREDWFSGAAHPYAKAGGQPAYAGLSQTMVFYGAVRIQTIESMT